MNFKLEYILHPTPIVNGNAVVIKQLPEDVAKKVLLEYECHVDHEGFDLNQIEQEYYKHSGIQLTHDPTYYKDGLGVEGAKAILHPWIEQVDGNGLIIDHSHFVFRYPILGPGAEQIIQYAPQRPELCRLLNANYKCGLDLCIDYINYSSGQVEPIVHIEWDFDCTLDMRYAAERVEGLLAEIKWKQIVPVILRYNKMARERKIDAFAQADTRSMILFGDKAYKLIPTL